jgi:carboxymethylenebutenolidase
MGTTTDLGGVNGYLAQPKGKKPWPGLIVIQEWWGLDDQTRSIANRFAAVGCLAFAPDLYHGELARLGDSQAAMELMKKHAPAAPEDLARVFDALARHPACTGTVGSVGFCFGGRMSLELALQRKLAAVCTFYGGGMQQLFERLGALACPVLGLFGDKDVSIPAGTVEEFGRILDRIGVEHEIVTYPDSGHAFFRDSDPSVFKPEASKDAWDRATRFFAAHLTKH